MRTRHIAATALALSVLATPRDAAAWVVVRAPVYYAPRPVVVVPPPVYVAPAPVYVVPPPPAAPPPQAAPPPPALVAKLPVNTRLEALPSGCTPVWVGSQPYQVCGENWLKGSDDGPYYVVVPAPQ